MQSETLKSEDLKTAWAECTEAAKQHYKGKLTVQEAGRSRPRLKR
jgi:hypothetical protein